jgi:bifunctional non-homologous end joining protein LigD
VCARRVLRPGPSAEVIKGPVPKRRDARQRAIQFDPMPERVEPCLALLASKPPVGKNWDFEVKWDGYRLAIHIEPGRKVRIITRGGHDWTSRFPAIPKAAQDLDVDTAILDGEAVVLNERGDDGEVCLRSLPDVRVWPSPHHKRTLAHRSVAGRPTKRRLFDIASI